MFSAQLIKRSLCAIQVQKEQWVSGDKCGIMNPETKLLQRESGHRETCKLCPSQRGGGGGVSTAWELREVEMPLPGGDRLL